jgi:hypothetical protein
MALTAIAIWVGKGNQEFASSHVAEARWFLPGVVIAVALLAWEGGRRLQSSALRWDGDSVRTGFEIGPETADAQSDARPEDPHFTAVHSDPGLSRSEDEASVQPLSPQAATALKPVYLASSVNVAYPKYYLRWWVAGSDETGEVPVPPDQEEVLLGRDEAGVDVVVSFEEVSKQHLQLVFNRDGSIQLMDFESTNGTWLLYPGDETKPRDEFPAVPPREPVEVKRGHLIWLGSEVRLELRALNERR